MIRGGIEKRDLICTLLSDFAEIMDSDCMFSVTDVHTFIAYHPGRSVDIKVKIRAPVPEQSPLYAAAQTKRAVTKTVPKEVWGVPFRSTATPICDSAGQVVGCVGFGISIERESQLIDTYQNFSELLARITGEAGHISDSIKQVDEGNVTFLKMMQKARNEANQTKDLLLKINEIAAMTDILAVNASIEAARAGVYGKGFAVIASEIKSLSQNTKKITQSTVTMLNTIVDSIHTLSQLTQGNNAIIQNQISEIDNIAQTVEGMQKVADNYAKLVR